MANVSSATGTLYIEGPWKKKDCINLAYLLAFQDATDHYGFYLEPINYVIDNLIVNKSIGFSGSGRWSFTNNLEQFHNWTKDGYSEHLNNLLPIEFRTSEEAYKTMRSELLISMLLNKLKIVLDFKDYEGGVSMAYHAVGTITTTHTYYTVDHTHETFFEYIEEEFYEYEPNLKFYCEEIVENEDELLDILYKIIDHYPEKNNKANRDSLYNFVTSKDNWCGLIPYSYYEEVDAIPKEIQNFLTNLGKEDK
jgi:hypothetical protein